MSTKTPSKKRKRDSTAGMDVVFKLSDATPSGSGPVLVHYPAIQGPPSITFQRYAPKKAKTNRKNEGAQTGREREDPDEQEMLVVGETEEIEFVTNTSETEKAADNGCKYLVAVFDRETSALSILPTAKSPHILNRTVKSLKSVPLSLSSSLQYREAKTALGEAFGTKKAKANLRAQARNHVDVTAMEGVMDHLQEGIDKGAGGLLTKDQAEEAADVNRTIPPYDTSASDPSDVYPLHGIIPEVEWKALSVSPFEEAGSHKEWTALLPYKTSDWIHSHIKGMVGKLSKSNKKTLKILLYVAAMFAVRKALQFNKKGIDKEQLAQKMPGVPPVITDSLLAKFTEVSRGSAIHTSTSGTELNLLSHMLALCLKVDNFATDSSLLAHDLSMPPPKVNQIFKSLGCKIRVLSERERTQLGLPDSNVNTKYAVLTAPVVFPKIRTGSRKTTR